jgi:isopentenyl-diphosphate delta-isomerase
MTPPEQVVLVDDAGRGIGVADKAAVHGTDTPLHLAFSCYVFDADRRLLLTRRAEHKRTWPGVWTNSACGHPAPGEPIAAAVRRRLREELGVMLESLTLMLPEFRYRAEMADGIVEHELCPVFVATTSDEVCADPAEVAEHRWAPWSEVRPAVLDGSFEVSPWCRLQVGALPETPYDAPAGDPHLLPLVVRP